MAGVMAYLDELLEFSFWNMFFYMAGVTGVMAYIEEVELIY